MYHPAHKAKGVNRTRTMRFGGSVFTGKERDEETGYGYFSARYMDHELMTMWLSVDPLADKYPSISPYAYCAWNPVKLMDPNGKEAIDEDDWYRNKYTNAVFWREGHAKQIQQGGDTYDNIGESYSALNIDGTYSNYYQNYLITIGDEQDVSKMAYRDKGLRTFLISNRSKLPICHKQDLFNSHVACRGVYLYNPTSDGHAIGVNATFCGIIGLNLNGGIYIDSDGGLGLYGGVNYCTGIDVGLGLEYSYISTGQIHSGENQLLSGGWILSGSYNIKSKTFSFSKPSSKIEFGLSSQVGWTWYSPAIPLF